jgi:hypothetical protein
MLNRRDFFKYSLLGTAGLAIGLGIPSVALSEEENLPFLQAFIPDEKDLPGRIMRAYFDFLPAEMKFARILRTGISQEMLPELTVSDRRSFLAANNLHVKMQKLPQVLGADLLLSSQKGILDPRGDLSGRVLAIRQSLGGKQAQCLLSFELVSRFSAPQERASEICIKKNGHVIQSLDLSVQNQQHVIPDLSGNTVLSIESGSAYISQATCKSGLCKQQGSISHCGEKLICAPAGLIITAC